MREEVVDIATADGPMETFVCRPERGGPWPAVFFLMDAPGIRDELHDMARWLATVGYFVMLPNLYYRAGRGTKYGPDVLDPASPDHARMRSVRTRMSIPAVMEDIGGECWSRPPLSATVVPANGGSELPSRLGATCGREAYL